MNPLIYALMYNDQEALKLQTNLIAHAVRDELEDFHVKHLTDAQMKELNPLIRNAIYNSLFAMANVEKHEECAKIIEWHLMAIPPYWEAPKLNDHFEKVNKVILNRKPIFKAAFLNEQYQLGNIKYLPAQSLIRLIMAFDYKGIKEEERSRYKDKIVNALKKEGYKYDFGMDGYTKAFWE
jgi:hypothetical protein